MLSVVKVIRKSKFGVMYGVPVCTGTFPLISPKFIGSGGHSTEDMQHAQVFGFSKAARTKVNKYRNDPDNVYEVTDVVLVPVQEVEWQPIETAPRNRSILVTRDYNDAPIRVVHWDEFAEYWTIEPGSRYAKPTHWRELPNKPPQKDKKDWPE